LLACAANTNTAFAFAAGMLGGVCRAEQHGREVCTLYVYSEAGTERDSRNTEFGTVRCTTVAAAASKIRGTCTATPLRRGRAGIILGT